jgi:glucoamylase
MGLPLTEKTEPFGGPGLPSTWSPASKQAIGTAFNDTSKVWFTVARGIITEVYYPTVDRANTRDLRFLVTDGKTFFDEEGKDTTAEVEYINKKALAFIIKNTAKSGKYKFTKRIITDPQAQSLVMKTSFEAIEGSPEDYRIYLLFAPHINNMGCENSGRCARSNNRDHLIAWREDTAAVVTANVPFLKKSAGFVGASDGWQDLKEDLSMDWTFERAEGGNIALMAELPPSGDFIIVTSFGRNEAEAIGEAEKTLSRPYSEIEKEYIKGWNGYVKGLLHLGKYSPGKFSGDKWRRFWTSAMVLKAHEDKTYKGGVIASLSIPWGYARGDKDVAGYHFVWPRDLVKAAFGFMAMGDTSTSVNILKFLQQTQYPDGSWPQNMWLDGRAHWGGIQLDEVALPIMLAWRLKEMGLIGDEFYPMVKGAASYLVRYGPITEQERWEENMGFSPSTLASEVASLVCAAHWAGEMKETKESRYLFSIADYWAARIEDWTFAKCDCLKRNLPGHYLRIVKEPPEALASDQQVCHAEVFIRHLPEGVPHHQGQIVDGGFLELVRYGLRDPDDVHVKSSLEVVDSMLKVPLPPGVAFLRYNGDAYGEKQDGSPFDGSGIGRPWPLLTGERAMYELISGNNGAPYIKAMEGFANEGLMFPEQVWNSEDIPEKNLYAGRGTGSATPLMWAHAEYIKVLRTKKDRAGCDIIPEVKRRYVEDKTTLGMSAWKANKPIRRALSTDRLRIINFEPCNMVWSADRWHTKWETPLEETGLDLYYHDFGPGHFKKGTRLIFTFHYKEQKRWEGKDYEIDIG